MVHDEEWAEQFYNVQQGQFRSEADVGGAGVCGSIKMKDKTVSFSTVKCSFRISEFQLHRTDHLRWFQAKVTG